MSLRKFFPGLGLIALLVALASLGARQPELSALGASPLTLRPAASAVALAGTAVTTFRSRFCNTHSRIS